MVIHWQQQSNSTNSTNSTEKRIIDRTKKCKKHEQKMKHLESKIPGIDAITKKKLETGIRNTIKTVAPCEDRYSDTNTTNCLSTYFLSSDFNDLVKLGGNSHKKQIFTEYMKTYIKTYMKSFRDAKSRKKEGCNTQINKNRRTLKVY
jgi:hypothetical protein